MAVYAESEDLITVGAYQKGSNPQIDAAIEKHAEIEDFLIQEETDPSPINNTIKRLGKLAGIEIPGEEYGLLADD